MNRFTSFMLFLLCGLSIFVGQVFLLDPIRTIYLAGVTVAFLLAAIWTQRKEDLNQYSSILFAFFIASLVFTIQLFWSSGTTLETIVFNKLVSTAIVVVPIIAFIKVMNNDMGSIYVKTGDLKQGLIIGVVTLLIFIVTAIPASIYLFGGQEVTADRLLVLIPWIATFVLLNGLKEEVLFRGLFLKKYESFMTPGLANLLQAVIFSLAHLQPMISEFVIIYLILTFFLGIAFGKVMQDTDSLLGSILFHAAADIPVILAVFSFL